MKLKKLGNNVTELDLVEGKRVLVSYETPVAYSELTPEGRMFYMTDKKWSRTTSKHISQWMPKDQAIEKPQEFFDNLI